MDGFAAIPVFVAVVDKGGFSQAARALGVSKSAVSKRVTSLEDQLGVRLLHRTTRKLSLTEAGERYYAHAVRAVAAAAQAQDAVSEIQADPQGRLKVSAPMSFGRLHVAPLIAGFLARFPKLEVDLVLDDRKIDLVAEGYDVAIRVGELPDSTLVARKLAAVRHVVCASQGYLERMEAPRKPADLAAHNCILYSYSSDANAWNFSSRSGSESVVVSGNYRVNNSEALREALLGGLGIGRLPTFVAGPDIASGRLLPLLEGYRAPERMAFAVMPERQHVPAKVRAFLDFAIESFGGEEPYWDR